MTSRAVGMGALHPGSRNHRVRAYTWPLPGCCGVCAVAKGAAAADVSHVARRVGACVACVTARTHCGEAASATTTATSDGPALGMIGTYTVTGAPAAAASPMRRDVAMGGACLMSESKQMR